MVTYFSCKRLCLSLLPGIMLLAAGAVSCYGKRPVPVKPSGFINPAGTTIRDRVMLPEGYSRVAAPQGSFAAYLSNTKLKPDGAVVHYYNGKIKNNNGIYVAVVDMPIGHSDLQQCADVIMHLRAAYLYESGQGDKIHFMFTNGFRAEYSKWKAGYRISLAGNKATWMKSAQPGDTQAGFAKYMDVIYSYCGTLSLAKELKKVSYTDLQPGDILITGGSPGHAELVMDVAQNKNGKKIYLLAQGYMPAQEMQVLANPANPALGPWYEADPAAGKIQTPEWDFTTSQLMRFED